MTFDNYERLTFERKPGGVLLITIDRPEKYNAADNAMLAEFARVWRDVAEDEETRVAVITGRGKAFSAGGDLNGKLRSLAAFLPPCRPLKRLAVWWRAWSNATSRSSPPSTAQPLG